MECVFCRIVSGETAGHVILDEPEVCAFLDARPVFKGHTLVVPRRHLGTLAELSDDLMTPLMKAAQRVAAAMQVALESQGSFVALNNVVSQSVPHLHVHVVPRTKGDGLRGFFWPRTKYVDETEAAEYARSLRQALEES